MRRREEKMVSDAPTVPDAVVRAAMAEPGLRGRVFLCSKRREALVCDDQVVGFVSPHETKGGWRHGPIFVLPAFRGRGLVEAYYAAHPERRCVSFIQDANKSSRRAHERAGFVNWKRGPKGWYMRREPLQGVAMAKQKITTGAQVEIPLAPPSTVTSERDAVHVLVTQLAATIAALPLDARVEALNRARMALHEVSPFKGEPVDLVIWVKGETVDANDYNPNRVAPPEMQLLRHSIEADGYTQPIVTTRNDFDEASEGDPIGHSETVDGFHRGRCGKEVPAIRERVHGYLPITRIQGARMGLGDRIAATIRHNRARGTHGVDSMSEIVRMLHVAGWPDEKIQVELGMQADEVLRLKQITGLAALFADRDFSEAWEPST